MSELLITALSPPTAQGLPPGTGGGAPVAAPDAVRGRPGLPGVAPPTADHTSPSDGSAPAFALLMQGFFQAAQAPAQALTTPSDAPLSPDLLPGEADLPVAGSITGNGVPPAQGPVKELLLPPTAPAALVTGGKELPVDGETLPAGVYTANPVAAGADGDPITDPAELAGTTQLPEALADQLVSENQSGTTGRSASPHSSLLAELGLARQLRAAESAKTDGLARLPGINLSGGAPSITTDTHTDSTLHDLMIRNLSGQDLGADLGTLPTGATSGDSSRALLFASVVQQVTGNTTTSAPLTDSAGFAATTSTPGTPSGSGSPVGNPLGTTGTLPPLQPFGDAVGWSQGLGERLLTLSDQGMQSAKLKLYPEHLGELDVQIQIEDGQASVWFHTAHGHTKDAIESALPKLREMFAEQGIDLVKAHVDSGQGRQSANAGAGEGWQTPPESRWGGESPRSALLGGLNPSSLQASSESRRLLDILA